MKLKFIAVILMWAGLANLFALGIISVIEDFFFVEVSDLWWAVILLAVSFMMFSALDMIKFYIKKEIEKGTKM